MYICTSICAHVERYSFKSMPARLYMYMNEYVYVSIYIPDIVVIAAYV